MRRVNVIVAHELRILRRDPLSVLILLIFPVIVTAFLRPAFRVLLVQSGHPHATGAEQVVRGQAVMDSFYLVSLVTLTFFSEHSWKTWDRLRASCASPIEIVLGKSLPRVAVGIGQLGLLMMMGVLVFQLHISGRALALLPLIVAFCVLLVLLGVAVTALCRSAQQAGAFAYLGMVLFGAIGGAFVPLNVLPAWARTVAPVTPTYWAMRGMHSVILDGRGYGAVALPCVVLLAMAAACALVGLTRMRFEDVKTGWL